jgi:hypothetical protein
VNIDWSKVPKGTPVKHASGHGVLFSRVGHQGRVYFKNITGIETWYGEENVRLADPADIAKYRAKSDDGEAAQMVVIWRNVLPGTPVHFMPRNGLESLVIPKWCRFVGVDASGQIIVASKKAEYLVHADEVSLIASEIEIEDTARDWDNAADVAPVSGKTRIDWSRLPKGTPLRHSRGRAVLFSRKGDNGKIWFRNIVGDEVWCGSAHLSLIDPADIAKYSVPDPDEAMASRLCKHASEHHDKKRDIRNADRLISEAKASLLTPEEIGAAFLAGNTIQYRPIGSDKTAWVTAAEGSHNIDLDTYEYRVKPIEGSTPYCPATDVEARADMTEHDRRVEESYKRWVANEVDAGLVDEAVKDRAIKMMITGAMKIEEIGIAPDTIERLMPTAMAFFKKAILDGHFDEESVGRFNGLVKEGKVDIQCDGHLGKTWVSFEADILYRLRPTPRYRAFTPEEAVKHLGREIKQNGSKYSRYWSLSDKGIWIENTTLISLEQAARECTFADTGEPFGVLIKEE